MTPAQLFDSVRFYTNRSDANTVLMNFAEAATGRLNTALRDHPRMYRQGVHQQPALRTLLPLPYDCLQLRQLSVNGTVLRQYPATVLTNGGCRPALGFIERGDCIELLTAPLESTQYTIGYCQALTAPSPTAGENNWVLQFFPDVYLYTMLSDVAIAIKYRA